MFYATKPPKIRPPRKKQKIVAEKRIGDFRGKSNNSLWIAELDEHEALYKRGVYTREYFLNGFNYFYKQHMKRFLNKNTQGNIIST
jgi:hypothetical protein